MKKRLLGDTDIKTSLVGLGGGQFAGSDHSVSEIKNIVQVALNGGVNLIDTARDYGEERLGEALKEVKEEYYICSKTLAKDRQNAFEDIKGSVKKLNQDEIDIYLVHNPMDVQDYEHRKDQGVLKALKEAKDEGFVGNIGVSSDYVGPLKAAVQDDVDVIMAQYNVGNTLSEDIIQEACDKSIGVIASKPFAGGILVDPETDVEDGKYNEMTPEKALNFTLSNENISSALVGARYPWQAEECADVGKDFRMGGINREEIKTETFNFLGDNFCRDCRYCWPCEELGYEFDIPEILRFLDRYEKYGYRRFPRIGFTRLPFKDRIEDVDRCDVACPFDIGLEERLGKAKDELDLEVSEGEWSKKIDGIEGKITEDRSRRLRQEIQKMHNDDVLDFIHTELIPKGSVDEKFGILLMEGAYSFGADAVLDVLKTLESSRSR